MRALPKSREVTVEIHSSVVPAPAHLEISRTVIFPRNRCPRRRVTPRRADQRAPRTRVMSAVVDFIKKTHEDAVVKVGKNVAIAALLLNIFFPGIGTLVACVVADKTVAGIKCFACMWLMCLVFLVGWVWSVWHGVLILRKA